MDERPQRSVVFPHSRSRWRRSVRYLYLRLMRMQATPRAIARGIAAGAFSGLFPFFGLQIIIAVGLCVPLRGNKLAAAAATWISNPFTYVPIYLFNLQVGQWLLGLDQPLMPQELDYRNWAAWGWEMILSLLLGCTVMGLIAAVICYFLGLWFVHRIRRQRRSQLVQLP